MIFFRLCALSLTIPSTTASVQRSLSALKRIKTYQKILQEKIEFWDYLLFQLKYCKSVKTFNAGRRIL